MMSSFIMTIGPSKLRLHARLPALHDFGGSETVMTEHFLDGG